MRTTRRHFLATIGGAIAGLLAAPSLRQGPLAALAQQSPTGPALAGPISLNTGIVVVRAQFNDTGHFAAALVPAPQSANPPGGSSPAPASNLFDQTGMFKGAAVAVVSGSGTYFMQVTADAPCQFGFEQPQPQTVTAAQLTRLSGRGQDVSAYFTLPGTISSLSLQTTSTTLRGWLYHLDAGGGEAVQGGVAGADGRFFDLSTAGLQTSYPVTLPDSGPYLLAVAGVDSADTWTFTFF